MSLVPGVALVDSWLGVVVHPAGTAFVSLRSTVRDVAGNQAEQSVIRACGVTQR